MDLYHTKLIAIDIPTNITGSNGGTGTIDGINGSSITGPTGPTNSGTVDGFVTTGATGSAGIIIPGTSIIGETGSIGLTGAAGETGSNGSVSLPVGIQPFDSLTWNSQSLTWDIQHNAYGYVTYPAGGTINYSTLTWTNNSISFPFASQMVNTTPQHGGITVTHGGIYIVEVYFAAVVDIALRINGTIQNSSVRRINIDSVSIPLSLSDNDNVGLVNISSQFLQLGPVGIITSAYMKEQGPNTVTTSVKVEEFAKLAIYVAYRANTTVLGNLQTSTVTVDSQAATIVGSQCNIISAFGIGQDLFTYDVGPGLYDISGTNLTMNMEDIQIFVAALRCYPGGLLTSSKSCSTGVNVTNLLPATIPGGLRPALGLFCVWTCATDPQTGSGQNVLAVGTNTLNASQIYAPDVNTMPEGPLTGSTISTVSTVVFEPEADNVSMANMSVRRLRTS